MIVIDDNAVCRECGAYSAGNGWCANLPGHPFEPVPLEEYVACHPEDRAAAAYLRSREAEVAYWRERLAEGASPEQIEQEVSGTATATPAAAAAAIPDWKRALGTPGSARRVLRPDVDEEDPELVEYGGGPSFDDVYTTALLDWILEWRNVGRSDGHMASLVVTRNETGLSWTDGWTPGDEALEAIISAAMADLDEQLDEPVRPAARAPVRAAAPAAPIAFDPFDPFTE
jgi:hypothetical protein